MRQPVLDEHVDEPTTFRGAQTTEGRRRPGSSGDEQQAHDEQLPRSLPHRRKLTEPDAKFIREIAGLIRVHCAPAATCALWLGVPRKQWKLWRQRHGEPYDTLKDAVVTAQAHVEFKLRGEVAKRSPGQALKGVRRIRDDEHEPASRPYHKHGLTTLRRALPLLIERVTDSAIADAELAPVEQAARAWRDDVLADLGGPDAITATKRALLDAAVGSWLIVQSLDVYLFELAHTNGLVNRTHRRVFDVVEQRVRIADTPARQLQPTGLERAKPAVQPLFIACPFVCRIG